MSRIMQSLSIVYAISADPRSAQVSRTDFRRAGARFGGARPRAAAIFAKEVADQEDQRKNDPLNRQGGRHEPLCASMPKRDMSDVEERRPA